MDAFSPSLNVTLADKYDAENGTVFMTGVQALVRLPLLRRQLDAQEGLNTAGFISGYRGSPLGTYDKQLWQEKKRLSLNNIVFQPGVNEELAATAVWGTQQVNLFEGARYDGVFGIWYGKGPGVDRAGDVLKHANFFGTSPYGGVLALAGDDHACKSSTLPNQSDFAFQDAEIPLLSPANIEDVIEFGLKAIQMSRFAGLWVGMKTIAETMDASATVRIDLSRYSSITPQGMAGPPGGRNGRLHLTPAQQEEIHRHFRMPAAMAFAHANGFDHVCIDSPKARIGIAASGKAYTLVLQALHDLGLKPSDVQQIGLRVYKVGMVWPLEQTNAKLFARGLETVLVIEERRDVIEHQLRQALYDLPDHERPCIIGKRDSKGDPLISDLMDFDTTHVVQAILRVVPDHLRTERMQAVDAQLANRTTQSAITPLHTRSAFFCSGCPHNTSTKVPEGSRALAGIGCHYLASLMDRNTDSFTQMGGEGVPWVGMAPFTSTQHVFANLGDGTYFHSGSLAVRQAVAAGQNITFKILYNDAVAMTGGQPIDGQLTVCQVAAQVCAEGVGRIAIVSDDPDRHRYDTACPKGVTFDHRSRLDAVQRELRDYPGVSVLIYDQICATEKRRRRKRGTIKRLEHRVVINEAVCEGCGDCTTQSNCLSVEPIETEFGRKRRINQSTCNFDYSCVNGFCPSFVSVKGGQLKKQHDPASDFPLPEPVLPLIAEGEPFNILLTGIGGLGVTSLAGILGMAAHLQNWETRIVDQLGMAQKGGAVYSHVRIANKGTDLYTARIGLNQADLVLAADLVVAHSKAGLPHFDQKRTLCVADTRITPTAEFIADQTTDFNPKPVAARLTSRAKILESCPAADIATQILGDAIYAHMILAGFAWQSGWLPLERGAIARAIELNGAATETNKRAFLLGRRYAFDPSFFCLEKTSVAESLDDIVSVRSRDLIAYQNEAYAARYRSLVEAVRLRENQVRVGSQVLTIAVAKNLYKLMAIKDEYEIARLYSNRDFANKLKTQFEGPFCVSLHLAPPLFSRRNGETGLPEKRTFGPWIFPLMTLLARGKRLRGTRLDILERLRSVAWSDNS